MSVWRGLGGAGCAVILGFPSPRTWDGGGWTPNFLGVGSYWTTAYRFGVDLGGRLLGDFGVLESTKLGRRRVASEFPQSGFTADDGVSVRKGLGWTRRVSFQCEKKPAPPGGLSQGDSDGISEAYVSLRSPSPRLKAGESSRERLTLRAAHEESVARSFVQSPAGGVASRSYSRSCHSCHQEWFPATQAARRAPSLAIST